MITDNIFLIWRSLHMELLAKNQSISSLLPITTGNLNYFFERLITIVSQTHLRLCKNQVQTFSQIYKKQLKKDLLKKLMFNLKTI